MNAEVRLPEKPGADAALVEDLRLRLQGAKAQEIAARAEIRRVTRELAVARRLLQFFVAGPPPPRAATVAVIRSVLAALPNAEMTFHLDACQPHGRHTIVTGWAFCPEATWDGNAAAITLVFRHGTTAYTVPADRLPRPDVAAHFVALPPDAVGGARGLEGSGFTCEILNDSLPPGVELEIVLHLECAGLARQRSTGQTLLL